MHHCLRKRKKERVTYRCGKALAINDVARKRRFVQNHSVAGTIANHIEDATADQLIRRDGSAIRELHARRRPQGSREVPFCMLDAMLTEEEDVVLCKGRKGFFVCGLFCVPFGPSFFGSRA